LKLTENSAFLSIGLCTAICLTIGGAAWAVSAKNTALEIQLKTFADRFDRLELAMKEQNANNANERDVRLWIMLLRDRNKGGTLDIPDWVR
jgi:hypothetical protein